MTASTTVIATRECRKCGAVHPEDEFPPKRRICIDCKRQYNREYRAAHRDRLNAMNAEYRRENKERLAAYKREYDQANAAKVAERARRYRQRKAAELRAYREARKEERREAQRRWREAHPERHREISRDWAKRNPGKVRTILARREARIRGAGWTNITSAGLQARIEYYGGICWICRAAPFEHLDHVKPIAAGGPNILANIRPACAACNLSKRARWPFLLGVQ